MKFEITLALFTFIVSEFGANSVLDTSKLRVNLEHRKPSYQPMKVKPEDRRKLLPLFPRNMVKFIVSTEPPIKLRNSEYIPKAIKKPSLKKIHVQSTTESTYYAPRSKTVRAPLMKAKKFIEDVQPVRFTARPNRLASRFSNTKSVREEDIEPEIDIERGGQFIDSVEENATEDTILDESIEVTSNDVPPTPVSIRNFKYSGGVTRPKRDIYFEGNDLRLITNDIPLDIHFVEELKMDEKEFLFLSDGDQIEGLKNEKDTTSKDEEKYKRSIIEEENLASTIPSFTYTGRDMQLRNEIIYKNINE